MDIEQRDNEQLGMIIHYCERLDLAKKHFGDSYEQFLALEPFQDSCSLCLIQIGEAVNRLSGAFRDSHPEIEWRKIYGMRNHLVHAYEIFDAEIAWDAIENYIPSLHEFCQERFCS